MATAIAIETPVRRRSKAARLVSTTRETTREFLDSGRAGQARLDRIRAILDRPNAVTLEHGRCDCALCEQARANPFKCTRCGFSGEPYANPCSCRAEANRYIRLLQNQLHWATSGLPLDKIPLTYRASVRDESAASVRLRIREIKARRLAIGAICDGTDGDCCHTNVCCPVCIGDGFAFTDDGLALIRDLRIELGERSKPPVKAMLWQDQEGGITVDISGSGDVIVGECSRSGTWIGLDTPDRIYDVIAALEMAAITMEAERANTGSLPLVS